MHRMKTDQHRVHALQVMYVRTTIISTPNKMEYIRSRARSKTHCRYCRQIVLLSSKMIRLIELESEFVHLWNSNFYSFMIFFYFFILLIDMKFNIAAVLRCFPVDTSALRACCARHWKSCQIKYMSPGQIQAQHVFAQNNLDASRTARHVKVATKSLYLAHFCISGIPVMIKLSMQCLNRRFRKFRRILAHSNSVFLPPFLTPSLATDKEPLSWY